MTIQECIDKWKERAQRPSAYPIVLLTDQFIKDLEEIQKELTCNDRALRESFNKVTGKDPAWKWVAGGKEITLIPPQQSSFDP